jgi:hypothetical protein
MDTMKARVGSMEQLETWAAKLDNRFARAKGAGAEEKEKHRDRMDDLKAKHQAARAKLDRVRAAGNAKWESLKSGAESLWNELEAAFKKLSS